MANRQAADRIIVQALRLRTPSSEAHAFIKKAPQASCDPDAPCGPGRQG